MNPGPNRRRLIAIALVLVLAVGLRPIWQARAPGTAARAAGTVTAVPPPWQVGSLALQPCVLGKAQAAVTASAWCTQFTVPENRLQSAGRSIGLRVAVMRAAAEQPETDWIVFLDGGPGGAATADYPQLRGAFAEMARRRHVLLIDQRGTGDSNPLSCAEPGAAQSGDATPEVVDRANQLVASKLQTRLRRCLQKLQAVADPAMYTTGMAVEDLEAVRQALGAPLLNLVGISYGTRVAQQYATTYPGAVRSLVLDSAVPNPLLLGSEHARNLESSLQAQFERCAAEPACKQRFGDPYAAAQTLRRQLQAKPIATAARDPMTYAQFTQDFGAGDLAATLRMFAYAPATAALLPLAIDDALKGNATPLLAQEKLISDLVTEQLTDGVGLSVSCAEDVDQLRRNPADEDTLLGNTLVDYLLEACRIWPQGTRRAGFHDAFRSVAPVLVLAGEFDPVTPVRYGAEIVRGLPNARLLTLRGQGHGVMAAGCMPRLLGQFVDELAPARLDERCLDTLGYVPAFLGYNGAAP